MADQQVLEPHQQAMSDVDDLARVMYEVRESGGWSAATWAEQRYWRGMAAKVIDSGWRRSARPDQ